MDNTPKPPEELFGIACEGRWCGTPTRPFVYADREMAAAEAECLPMLRGKTWTIERIGMAPDCVLRWREAIETCHWFFQTIDDLHAVEGGDQRFVRKAKMHCWIAKWQVVAALTGRSLDEVMREHVESRINAQLPDPLPQQRHPAKDEA